MSDYAAFYVAPDGTFWAMTSGGPCGFKPHEMKPHVPLDGLVHRTCIGGADYDTLGCERTQCPRCDIQYEDGTWLHERGRHDPPLPPHASPKAG